MRSSAFFVLLIISFPGLMRAQERSLVNTSQSPFARQYSPDLHTVNWTGGFWGYWQGISRDTMVMNMLHIYKNDSLCHGFRNFEIAAGLKSGKHAGAPFHDGDFYKTLEALVVLYGQTRDERFYRELEDIIQVIESAQRADGYIHTPTLIRVANHPDNARPFTDRMDFETYNMGHLMTAACLHYRVSAQRNFLNIAEAACDFLVGYHQNATAEQARNAICPSHYMGVIEMYRTLGKQEYLELAVKMINIRGLIDDGSDHNQDRIPFRQQKEAVGHAVRANYLYAGVADLYAETGEDSLLLALNNIWEDVVRRKLYVTGACGALYDGVSPQGTNYSPDEIQQVHQAYGQAYELPNVTAHNETCANIGFLLWNFRMLQITGECRYADMLELSLYNSILSGTDLSGTLFNYTNPLRVDHSLPYTLRWSKEREAYIAWSNCCPPNVVRTLSEVNNYAYSMDSAGISVNLYGSNTLRTQFLDDSLVLFQSSNYPWDGRVKIRLGKTPAEAFELRLRIPGWAAGARIRINGEAEVPISGGGDYTSLLRRWNSGDELELDIPLEVTLLQSNPLVEANRNQVAIKRGPIVYCLESSDLSGRKLTGLRIPAGITFAARKIEIGGCPLVALEGEAAYRDPGEWQAELYRTLPQKEHAERISLRLVPYFAWGNRGKSEMSVWLPLEY